MKSFENVYYELEELFIHQFPLYIDKINKEYNDGIILKKFENRKLEEDCIKLPSFKFNLNESEYSEKDRIIENTIFTVSFEIKLQENEKLKIIILYRYLEAMQKMIEETDSCFIYHFLELKENLLKVKITL